MLRVPRIFWPSFVARTTHPLSALLRPELRRISKSLSSVDHLARFPPDRLPRRMERRMVSSDLARMRVTRKKHRWKRTVTCPWKPPRMKINCVQKRVTKTDVLGRGGRRGVLLLEISLPVGYPNARYPFFCPSVWAGPIGDDDLAGNVQVHRLTYETEPDEEIFSGGDALSICNMRHGIRGVARVDKKGRSARFWMILRKT